MTRRRWLPATGLGAVLAAASSLAAWAVADAQQEERETRVARAADAFADQVATTLERHVTEMELLATTSASPSELRRNATIRLAAVDELAAVAVATGRGDQLVVDTVVPSALGWLNPNDDLHRIDDLRAMLDRVRVEADATAGAPFRVDGEEYVLVGAPLTVGLGAPESDARAAVAGVVLGAVRADAILGPWSGQAALTAPNGLFIGDVHGDAIEMAIELRGRTWILRLEPGASGWPTAAVLVLVVGLALALAAAIVLHVQVVRRRVAEEQAESRSLQLERIADAGARLQQSLDLAELLPAFAVALAQDFDLDGVAVSLLDEDGALVEAFATGDAAGQSIDLPLRRGWRAVGVLSVRPGRTLDRSELTSVQALADLLAVAMSNAQLYEREQLSAARLRDLDALKNAFLGTVSHELRTSMTAIMGFGELLSDSWDTLDDTRRREMANRIRRSAGSLRHLVDDLLDFARLEQERLRVSPRTIDLAGIVRQTVDNLGPLLGRHQVDLRIPGTLTAWADPVAVERILANLVSNAAKYSPEGSTVTIIAEPGVDVARLVVADEGPGIPAEERRRIFARFYRLDTPESVRTRGAGIGLAILRDFADRSGARVTVDDAPGGGARFTVDFPTEPVDVLAVAT